MYFLYIAFQNPDVYETKTSTQHHFYFYLDPNVRTQTVTISGYIRDENKKPLPGATVLEKGTTNGATTGDDGKYKLTVSKDAKAIIISYIGYEPQELAVNTSRGDYELNNTMTVSGLELNQVVVSVSKRAEKLLDAPASISVVGKEQLEKNVVTTPVDELKGVAGVDIMCTGPVSSNVVVTGFNDIFSGSVLNVVDDRIGSVLLSKSMHTSSYPLQPWTMTKLKLSGGLLRLFMVLTPAAGL